LPPFRRRRRRRPEHDDLVEAVTFPALLGDLVVRLWFAILGARERPATVAAS